MAVDEPREVGHFEHGGRHYEGTPKMRAQEIAQLPVLALGAYLAHCETFRDYARQVAEDESRADEIALRYSRAGAGRQVITVMLHEAARALDELPSWSSQDAISWRLEKLGIRAVFVDSPLEEADPRNALRVGKVDSVQRGAEIVARRGVGRCLKCGEHHDRDDRYCSSCSPYPSERRHDDHEARELVRAVAEQLGIRSNGPGARRVRRRTTCRRHGGGPDYFE